MGNELILIFSLIGIYSAVLLSFILFGNKGLICFTVMATITANIEVLVLIDAFGMEQTLGNIMFASTFLITDIISELYGKKQANQAVNIGIFVSLCFVVLSQTWLIYTPSPNDWAQPSMKTIFSNTPRIMLTGVAVYAIVQHFDVWAYHKWWSFTEKKADKRGYLWLRNNGSTLVSQLLNTVLFTLGAFWGVYDTSTLISIACASYIIFIVTSLADTPFIYLARMANDRWNITGRDAKDCAVS